MFYKEWLKTRWFFIGSLVIGLVVVAFMFIGLNSGVINAGGGSEYVYNWFRGSRPHYELFKNVPMVVALLIGVSQFAPEVLKKRIKLTLHLPYREMRLLYTMVLYGVSALLAVLLICTGLFFILDSYFFPAPMHMMALKSLVPYILAGFVTYFGVAMIAMEPNWLYRVLYAILVYFIVNRFFLNVSSLAGIIPILVGIMVIFSLGVLYTANRFKIGER